MVRSCTTSTGYSLPMAGYSSHETLDVLFFNVSRVNESLSITGGQRRRIVAAGEFKDHLSKKRP